jgi:uncharacterized protein (TIGR02246 family)
MMMGWKILGMVVVLATVITHATPARAEAHEPPSAAAIRQVLDDQVAAWNRGDVDAFMRGYKDSPDTTFIGKSIEHGYMPILERYKKAYSSKDAMGTLDFSDLSIRALSADYAVVTGRFHLARNAAGGGDVSGIFSLVWEKTAEGWKIVLDHSSVTAP